MLFLVVYGGVISQHRRRVRTPGQTPTNFRAYPLKRSVSVLYALLHVQLYKISDRQMSMSPFEETKSVGRVVCATVLYETLPRSAYSE